MELLQILQDGGGAGEIEESMMWYALQHEKVDDREASDLVENGILEPWMDATWRQNWLERLEKRECVFYCQIPYDMCQSLIRVQIQILLYMMKLSVAPEPVIAHPKKRKRSRKKIHVPSASLEERLENLMDKLSMLQLTSHLSTEESQLNRNERDWAQLFCEDVVEAA